MKEKIDTPQGCKIYEKRIGNTEWVFGNKRSCKRMDRFTLGSLRKSEIVDRLVSANSVTEVQNLHSKILGRIKQVF
jgi:hypothetical protein